MNEIVGYKEVEEKVLTVRGQSVLLDSSVAELYGVETKRVNEAVGNNPDKFPEGYVIALSSEEWEALRSKNSTLNAAGRGLSDGDMAEIRQARSWVEEAKSRRQDAIMA